MEQSSDLRTQLCLAWTTERPFLNKQRYSPYFSFLDSEWRLHMKMVSHPHSYRNKVYVIYLDQKIKTAEFLNSFRVTTFIEDMVESNFPSLGFTKVVKSGSEIIWQYEQGEVSENIPFVGKDDETWRIVCRFYDVRGMASENTDKTIHSMDAVSKSTSVDPIPDLERLSVDFSNLFKDESFSDVKFRCGDSTMSAHRAVLAARSEVLAAMFRSKMVERETGVVDVTDVESHVLDLLLKYLYSGKLQDVTEDIVLGLYEASDKYAVHALRKACVDWMISNMSEENCVSYLTFADAHGDCNFKNAVISFICEQEAVLHGEAWLRFSKKPSQLAIEVYQRIFRAKSGILSTGSLE